jgi:hypothetical protein
LKNPALLVLARFAIVKNAIEAYFELLNLNKLSALSQERLFACKLWAILYVWNRNLTDCV